MKNLLKSENLMKERKLEILKNKIKRGRGLKNFGPSGQNGRAVGPEGPDARGYGA